MEIVNRASSTLTQPDTAAVPAPQTRSLPFLVGAGVVWLGADRRAQYSRSVHLYRKSAAAGATGAQEQHPQLDYHHHPGGGPFCPNP
ncbi:MAG: hypothetical protein HC875_15805 [Anaerolineales bacterium]|nr:hypothetical protein [Anaerolineales bacterium]